MYIFGITILFPAISSSLFEITGVLGNSFTILWNFDQIQKGALSKYTFRQTFVNSSLSETKSTTSLNKDVKMYDVNFSGNVPGDLEGSYSFTLIVFPDTNPNPTDTWTTGVPLRTTLE